VAAAQADWLNPEDEMTHPNNPLIVGAGPVGLGAALFLARLGQATRIVEMRREPAQESRALAVNPRTLDLLEPVGLTPRMLELGLPVQGARFYRRGRLLTAVSFAGIHPRYPFMLALSQTTTERLLAQALEDAGGRVERGVQLVECRTGTGGVEAVLEPTAGGPREVVHCPLLLAADGAHSVARQQLGIDFVGSSFPGEWHLADVPLRTTLAADHAHIFFRDGGGFLFLIRVVDEMLEGRTAEPVWRVIANRPEPLAQLVQAEQVGPPVWASSFHIAHRIVATLATGGVYFAGDAAHIHSPVGARGMNLGLEDAWVFAHLLRANRLSEYDRLRRPVDRQVVRRVELLSRIASADSGFTRFVRTFVFPLVLGTPFLRTRVLATLTGLDHDLPPIGVDRVAERAAEPAEMARTGHDT
jgi:2-polyprenyl-6-methoxyphenol hydroxylase-like FAD-dependent oxidoreductase